MRLLLAFCCLLFINCAEKPKPEDFDLETAIEEIKKNTRRFAKRQLTWYRKDGSIVWFEYDTPLEEIVKEINRLRSNP